MVKHRYGFCDVVIIAELEGDRPALYLEGFGAHYCVVYIPDRGDFHVAVLPLADVWPAPASLAWRLRPSGRVRRFIRSAWRDGRRAVLARIQSAFAAVGASAALLH